ncbi:MAG: Uma2 family endonuclease [Gemmataceae bacterium]
MNTTAAPPRLTPDDLLRRPDGGMGYELVDGELRELSVSTKSSRVGGRVYRRLDEYADRAGGWAFPAETGFQCFTGNTVRKPDAAFIAWDRLTTEQYEDEGYCQVCPDLVVEVTSPNDLAWEVVAKRELWLAAGVRVVWEIDPDARLVFAHSAAGVTRFREDDTLTGDPVLPGFAVPVADLFKLPAPAGG